jgi:hypothetical protein
MLGSGVGETVEAASVMRASKWLRRGVMSRSATN